jgi:hypothetical protein
VSKIWKFDYLDLMFKCLLVLFYQKNESDCCLMLNEQFFRYLMERTCCIPWDDDVYFALDQHGWVNSYSACPLKQQFIDKHVSWHITQILSQPVFVLTPLCWMLSGEATNTYLIVFSLTRLGLEPVIYPTWCMHTNHYTTDAKTEPPLMQWQY